MSSSGEDITDGEPPQIDPYEVLALDRSATTDQVKSAYRKAALKHHPDKVPPEKRDEAHKTFQSIALAYAVLSDPLRRKRYDATGSTSDSLAADADADFDWQSYYASLFADAISAEAIERFAAEYRRSDEEAADVLAAYEEHLGDLDGVYASVMLSDVREDDERFRAIIDRAIEEGEVEAYRAYTKETKKRRQARLRAAQEEAGEAEEYAKELGIHDKLFGDKAGSGKGAGGGKKDKKKKTDGSEDALAALIKSNQQKRMGFLDRLEAKYAEESAPKRGKKRPAADEPSEEEFQAIRARLDKGKAESGGGKKSKRKTKA